MTQAAFSPEQRAKQREGEDIAIGDRVFRQVRRVPKVMRAYRSVVRQDEVLAREYDEVARKLDGLADNAPQTKRTDLEARHVEIENLREDLTYELVLCLIKASEGEDAPTLDYLQEHLDMEDLSQLLDRLTPGEDAQPTDPTPPAENGPTGN